MRKALYACLVGVVAACGAAPPHYVDERVETVGDTSYRATSFGDDVVLVAQRALGAEHGAGVVVMHHAMLAAAEASPHHKLAGARAWLDVAERAAGADAYTAAQRGLDELGADYSDRRGFDDTGTLVSLAAHNAASDPSGAADSARKALRTRIAMYVRLYAGAVE